MALAKAAVRFTANFEANLVNMAAYWGERRAPQVYLDVLNDLGDTVIANLERHPCIGRRFFARSAESVEVRNRVTALLKRFGAVEVREYLSGDYLLLYCIVPESGASNPGLTVYLLASRHHRQLSFAFEAFWRANRPTLP